MTTTVVNIKRDKYDVFCGRPSIWGNPHIIGHCKHCDKSHNRDEAIAAFETDFNVLLMMYDSRKESSFRDELEKLRDKVLGCFCKPARCHCDVLADFLNNSEVQDARIVC